MPTIDLYPSQHLCEVTWEDQYVVGWTAEDFEQDLTQILRSWLEARTPIVYSAGEAALEHDVAACVTRGEVKVWIAESPPELVAEYGPMHRLDALHGPIYHVAILDPVTGNVLTTEHIRAAAQHLMPQAAPILPPRAADPLFTPEAVAIIRQELEEMVPPQYRDLPRNPIM